MLHRFQTSVHVLALPERFAYPHHYQPHPLALQAAAELRHHLEHERKWTYDFGPAEGHTPGARGKMFGVLVVRTPTGELGYLRAFSGKVAESNHLPGFVPPVYDLLSDDSFYPAGERVLNGMSQRIRALEQSAALQAARERLKHVREAGERARTQVRAEARAAKRQRKARRQAAAQSHLPPPALAALEKELAAESIRHHFAVKDVSRAADHQIKLAEDALADLTTELDHLRAERAAYSNALQARIFAEYRFLDATGRVRDLNELFAETAFGTPPAGAGECAAPKLLQYAYAHKFTPIAMAEFWWGQSPQSEIRKHGAFYPACRGKCEPILKHMLTGIPVEPNPLLVNPAIGKTLDVVYEDDYLLVVNKPHEFLSVPGRHITDSVQTRLRARYPEATGPLIVHRLDMSTSGLLLVAKTKEVHKKVQQQFFRRSVRKRYVALLDGAPAEDHGFINLPLFGDVTDRPRQIVDAQRGKPARTEYRVLDRRADGRTLVHFWPVTGRTHQLRVHAAHFRGLNAPIVGDDLYGRADTRLMLHAEVLTFQHPVSREEVSVEQPVDFGLDAL